MNGIQYERSCAKYLSSLGYKNITLTKASGDQGIDIIATKGSLKYGFQCKYYSGTVGNDAVQQAFSGIAYYKLDKAVVITNSDFSSSARKLAEEVDVLLWDHVEPMEEDSRYTLYQVMAILLFGWSIIQLYQIFYSTEPTKDYQFISYSLLFISSFLQAIPHHAKIATGIALILSSIHAYMYSIQKSFSLFTLDYYQIVLFVFIIITFIRLVYYIKKYSIRRHANKRNQIRQDIQQTRHTIAQNMAEILANEFDCNVKVIDTKVKDNNLIITLQTNRTQTNQLAAVEEKLNHTQNNIQFELRATALHMIELTIIKANR